MNKLDKYVESRLKKDVPDFRAGDQVKVYVKIVEGGNERVQPFEGTVIRRRGGGMNETFTVRKTSFGVGVERIFSVNSPRIDKIEVVRKGKVRRSRLYYFRKLAGKTARIEQDMER